MLSHHEALTRIKAAKLVAILRHVPTEKLDGVVEALIAGGVRVLEFTFDHDRADCVKENAEKIRHTVEKYGDRVRVIQYGKSVELCGGTHVPATGSIGFFKVVSESAISAGVRRIEALTGDRAMEYVYSLEDTLRAVQRYVNNPSVTQAIKKLVEENSELNRQMEQQRKERIQSLVASIEPNLTEEDGVVLVARQLDLMPDVIKGIAFGLKPKFPNLVFVTGSAFGDKVTLTIMLGDEIVARGVNASKVIREAAKEIGGGGGGQPFFATAGGKKPEGLEKAIFRAVELIKGELK